MKSYTLLYKNEIKITRKSQYKLCQICLKLLVVFDYIYRNRVANYIINSNSNMFIDLFYKNKFPVKALIYIEKKTRLNKDILFYIMSFL